MSVWIKNLLEKVRKIALQNLGLIGVLSIVSFVCLVCFSTHSVITSVAGGRVCRNAFVKIFSVPFIFFSLFPLFHPCLE